MSTDLQITPLDSWLDTGGKPLVIAGPCSAESEFQVMETARRIAEIPQVTVFRAGLWKPRTRPGEFSGVGDKGLPWLTRVKEETGLKTTVEVADASHQPPRLFSCACFKRSLFLAMSIDDRRARQQHDLTIHPLQRRAQLTAAIEQGLRHWIKQVSLDDLLHRASIRDLSR